MNYISLRDFLDLIEIKLREAIKVFIWLLLQG